MGDLKTRSVRGGSAALLTQASRAGLGLASTAVLGRLLSPSDFGAVGIVLAVTGFFAMVRDMGLTMATIQRQRIDHEEASTLFWINLAVSLVLMMVTAATGPLVAIVYADARLVGITLSLSTAILFAGAAQQHQALLKRQMKFAALARIELASLISGIVATIAVAMLGGGYWSLVTLHVTAALTTLAVTWMTSNWRPGRPSWKAGVGPMMSLGRNLTGFEVVNYLARNADNLLIGWYWGAAALGQYSRAYQLLLAPLQQINAPISAVAVPALSRLQDDPDRFRRYYLTALRLIVLVTAPFSLGLIVLADVVVSILLGPQWSEAAAIFRLLGMSAIFQPVCNTAGWIYVANGRTRAMFSWGFLASASIVMSFAVGLPFGVEAVALCYGTVVLFLVWPCMARAVRDTSISSKDVFGAIGCPMLAALLAAAPTWTLKLAVEGTIIPLATLVACLACMILVYWLTLFYVFRQKAYYLSLFRLIRYSLA
jgi:O-antigen/teichoic acid export membrane protein